MKTLEEIYKRMKEINSKISELLSKRRILESEFENLVEIRDRLVVLEVPDNLTFLKIPYFEPNMDQENDALWLCYDHKDFDLLPICVMVKDLHGDGLSEYWYTHYRGNFRIYTTLDDFPVVLGEGRTKFEAYNMLLIREGITSMNGGNI